MHKNFAQELIIFCRTHGRPQGESIFFHAHDILYKPHWVREIMQSIQQSVILAQSIAFLGFQQSTRTRLL